MQASLIFLQQTFQVVEYCEILLNLCQNKLILRTQRIDGGSFDLDDKDVSSANVQKLV